MDDATEADRTPASRIAERIVAALQVPITLNGVDHVVSAGIGIAYGSDTASGQRNLTADQVLRDADTAMYRAKSRGKDHFEVFEPGMRRNMVERGRVEVVLRRAMESSRLLPRSEIIPRPRTGNALLTAAYQPIFDSRTGALAGFEALARRPTPMVSTFVRMFSSQSPRTPGSSVRSAV